MNKLSKNKETKLMIIENYIEWYTTDDRERDSLKQGAYQYVKEDHIDEIGNEDLDMIDQVIKLDEKLNGWWHALPFEALEEIHGVDLFGRVWYDDEQEEFLDSLYDEWIDMTMVEKAEYYDELHEKYSKITDQVLAN